MRLLCKDFGSGKAEDAAWLAPGKDDNAASHQKTPQSNFGFGLGGLLVIHSANATAIFKCAAGVA